jgi:hypothetical protein
MTAWLAVGMLMGLSILLAQTALGDISEGCVYATDGRGHNPQVITACNFDPQIYYYSGSHNRSYFLWMQKGGAGYSIENMVFYYDHDTEELSDSYGVGPGTYGATDPHGHGALIVADDGHIIVIHEQLWNTGPSAHNGPYQVKRSILPEDPSAGFTLTHTTAFGNCYPHIWKLANGDLLVSSRYGSDAYSNHYRVKFFRSTDNGMSWDAGTVVVNFGTAHNYWAYHTRICQSDSDGIHLAVNRCLRDPYYAYPDCYYLHSDDGVTWRNIDGSLVKNVVTDGALNVVEMDTYCLIEHGVGSHDIRSIAAGSVAPSGNVYLIQADAIRGDPTPPERYLRYWEGGEWQKILIPRNDRFMNGIYGMHAFSDTAFDIYVEIEGGTGHYEVERWQTLDRGQTWTEEALTSDSDFDHRYPQVTMNSADSPYIAVTSSYLVNSSYGDIFLLARPNSASGVADRGLPVARPGAVVLHENQPNPFNPQTRISYTLRKAGDVSLCIHDIGGGLVETLVDGFQHPGRHSIVWDAGNAGSGIYFYRISMGDLTDTRKCILLK